VSVIDWLLDGDPAIRWQVLRDLVNAPAGDVAAERARVEQDGWGARLLALEDPDGLWDGGACFPASYAGGGPGQPWTATMHTLQTLQLLGLDPASESARRAIGLVAENGRWEHPDPRMAETVAVLRSKRQPDGRWLLDRIHPGRVHFDLEGGVGTPSRWNTLRALRVLKWWEGTA
jgi:hypothetical protein